jgi:hypothetical protein
VTALTSSLHLRGDVIRSIVRNHLINERCSLFAELYLLGVAQRVWAAIMEAGREFGIKPCGLGARNTLRLEAALSLYGHEIDDPHEFKNKANKEIAKSGNNFLLIQSSPNILFYELI